MPRSSFSPQFADVPVAPESLATKRRALVRLGLAWLAMMQVMMFALPGYLRHEAAGQDSLEVLDWAIFLMNWASLTLTIPVVLYSAWPIWRGSAQALSRRRITMDIPVALSLFVAFIPSVIATFRGSGEVYFDSITMFVAFLLTARYIEQRASLANLGTNDHSTLAGFSSTLLTQANRVAMLFVCVQLVAAAVIAAVWWVIAPAQAWSVLVSLLVMSCPCALSLAAPVSLAALQLNLAGGEPLSTLERDALLARTTRMTRQNLYGALIWHVLTMPLAALGWVTPWLAALSMLFSSAAVLLNAWRLYRSRRMPFSQRGRATALPNHLQT